MVVKLHIYNQELEDEIPIQNCIDYHSSQLICPTAGLQPPPQSEKHYLLYQGIQTGYRGFIKCFPSLAVMLSACVA